MYIPIVRCGFFDSSKQVIRVRVLRAERTGVELIQGSGSIDGSSGVRPFDDSE